MLTQPRLKALRSLISFGAPLDQIAHDLEPLPIDCEPADAVELTHRDAAMVLARYLAGMLHSADVQTWAKLIEPRGDIRYPATGAQLLARLMFRLANQDVSDKLTMDSATEWLESMNSLADEAGGSNPALTRPD